MSRHEPGLARRTDGCWGVFCQACSEQVGEYVYPCLSTPRENWPPAVLIGVIKGEAEEYHTRHRNAVRVNSNPQLNPALSQAHTPPSASSTEELTFGADSWRGK